MKADTMIIGDAVFTGLADRPEQLAVVVKDHLIIDVCSHAEAKKYEDAATEVINAGNRLVMPGFFDSHLHLLCGSLFNHYSVNLADVQSAEKAAQKVKAYADEQPEANWVIGTGWDHTAWGDEHFPDRHILDQYMPDRPVLLIHAEGHYAWVNTKALQLASITKVTPNPDYGVIYKDEDGSPTGILIESAISLAGEFAYDFSDETKRDMVNLFLDEATSVGVTSVSDLYMSRAHEQLEAYDVLKEFDEDGRLSVRVHLYPPLNGNFEKARKMKDSFTSPKLKFSGLKQFIDGVVTGYTAYMLDPYKDRPETKGEIGFSEEQLQRWVTQADKEGYQIRFHTIGDGAVRLGLDLFENAQKENGKRDSRHELEHIEIVSTEDIPRFKELGVTPSIQPYHMALMPRESHTERVTEDKFPYLYTNATLFNAVNKVPYSSDYPIVPLNPMLGIYHAVTRMDYSLEESWNGQEKVDLATALRAYTLYSAYTAFRENEIGTLEKGKLADVIMLDRNLFETDPKEILETEVDITMVDGDIVYQNTKIAAAR